MMNITYKQMVYGIKLDCSKNMQTSSHNTSNDSVYAPNEISSPISEIEVILPSSAEV